MARRAKLDDPTARETYLAELAAGADLAGAAEAIGMTRRAVQNYRAANPDFEDLVSRAQALSKAQWMAEDASRASAGADTGDDAGDDDDLPTPRATRPNRKSDGQRRLPADMREFVFNGGLGLTTEEYIRKCVAAAENPDHRASATCHKILAALLVEPLVMSLRQQVVRSGAIDDQRAGMVPQAEDESDTSAQPPNSNGVILVRLPRNGSEAPGRGPLDRVVIDAQVVDGAGEM